jgi:serine phosphatase RsbU (regulator of sigma subunit)
MNGEELSLESMKECIRELEHQLSVEKIRSESLARAVRHIKPCKISDSVSLLARKVFVDDKITYLCNIKE